MRALMASRSREGTPQFPGLPPAFEQRGSSPFPMPDPLSAMAPAPRGPKTLLEKLLPLLHATSILAFLVFFLSRTNSSFISTDSVLSTGHWKRWGDLATASPKFGWSEDHQVCFLPRFAINDTESLSVRAVYLFSYTTWLAFSTNLHTCVTSTSPDAPEFSTSPFASSFPYFDSDRNEVPPNGGTIARRCLGILGRYWHCHFRSPLVYLLDVSY